MHPQLPYSGSGSGESPNGTTARSPGAIRVQASTAARGLVASSGGRVPTPGPRWSAQRRSWRRPRSRARRRRCPGPASCAVMPTMPPSSNSRRCSHRSPSAGWRTTLSPPSYSSWAPYGTLTSAGARKSTVTVTPSPDGRVTSARHAENSVFSRSITRLPELAQHGRVGEQHGWAVRGSPMVSRGRGRRAAGGRSACHGGR